MVSTSWWVQSSSVCRPCLWSATGSSRYIHSCTSGENEHIFVRGESFVCRWDTSLGWHFRFRILSTLVMSLFCFAILTPLIRGWRKDARTVVRMENGGSSSRFMVRITDTSFYIRSNSLVSLSRARSRRVLVNLQQCYQCGKWRLIEKKDNTDNTLHNSDTGTRTLVDRQPSVHCRCPRVIWSSYTSPAYDNSIRMLGEPQPTAYVVQQRPCTRTDLSQGSRERTLLWLCYTRSLEKCRTHVFQYRDNFWSCIERAFSQQRRKGTDPDIAEGAFLLRSSPFAPAGPPSHTSAISSWNSLLLFLRQRVPRDYPSQMKALNSEHCFCWKNVRGGGFFLWPVLILTVANSQTHLLGMICVSLLWGIYETWTMSNDKMTRCYDCSHREWTEEGSKGAPRSTSVRIIFQKGMCTARFLVSSQC